MSEPTRSDERGRPRMVAAYEVPLIDGGVRILRGNPRYCPQEQAHEPHEFDYVYLDTNEGRVAGLYFCKGDPAPWVTGSGAQEATP